MRSPNILLPHCSLNSDYIVQHGVANSCQSCSPPFLPLCVECATTRKRFPRRDLQALWGADRARVDGHHMVALPLSPYVQLTGALPHSNLRRFSFGIFSSNFFFAKNERWRLCYCPILAVARGLVQISFLWANRFCPGEEYPSNFSVLQELTPIRSCRACHDPMESKNRHLHLYPFKFLERRRYRIFLQLYL